MEHDLKKLLNIFSVATKHIVGCEQNLPGLETALNKKINNSPFFDIDHLNIILDFDKKYWNGFDYFWRPPDISLLDFKKINEGINLRNHDRINAINILNDQFKNIEIVSIVLRFIDPDNFGIISSPVQKILEVKRDFKTEKTYVYYLDNLNIIKESYDFHKIAHVDMAVFVYSIILEDIYSLEGEEKAKKWAPQYAIDIVKYHEENVDIIKQIRAANLLSQLWDVDNKLRTATLLIETDYHSAGLLAGQDLERCIIELCEKNNIKTYHTNQKPFKRLTLDLEQGGIIDRNMRYELDMAWETRTLCVHVKEQRPHRPLERKRVEHLVTMLKNIYAKLNE